MIDNPFFEQRCREIIEELGHPDIWNWDEKTLLDFIEEYLSNGGEQA